MSNSIHILNTCFCFSPLLPTLSQRPSYFLSYLIGYCKIMELRQELCSGPNGLDLPAFHNMLLGVGTIPFKLVRELLFE